MFFQFCLSLITLACYQTAKTVVIYRIPQLLAERVASCLSCNTSSLSPCNTESASTCYSCQSSQSRQPHMLRVDTGTATPIVSWPPHKWYVAVCCSLRLTLSCMVVFYSSSSLSSCFLPVAFCTFAFFLTAFVYRPLCPVCGVASC